MDTLYVFRNNSWFEWKPVIANYDPRWTTAQKNIAATAYLAALEKGHTKERATQLSEAVVFKSIYHGLTYEKHMENQLRGLYS